MRTIKKGERTKKRDVLANVNVSLLTYSSKVGFKSLMNRGCMISKYISEPPSAKYVEMIHFQVVTS